MDHFEYRDGTLCAEDVSLSEIARVHGTPTFVYSRATLSRHFQAFDQALTGMPHLVCYAVKANSNLAVLQILERLDAGFDIVSGGELDRVMRAGAPARRIVFSGVGKTETEMRQALTVGIRCFNVESEAELERLNRVAVAMNKRAPVSFRVNPDVDPRTHPYISTGLKENKFGVDIATAERLYREASEMPGITVVGIGCHIGSQLLDLSPFMDALDRLLALVERLKAQGITLRHIDVGGGLGVRYRDENPPDPAALVAAIRPKLEATGLEVMMEPGRAIAGNAGVLLTRVEYLKPAGDKHFCIVDAAMNDLIRPALYDAWQAIVPVRQRSDLETRTYDVVGPVCESGDWLGHDRELAVSPGDLLAVRTAGAYGFTMASNYNSRPRAAEIVVDGTAVHLVRARESYDDLVRGEAMLPL
ncbi:diaminopimelate decarboxylase [Algiphilus sp. W345]|uniref:Diaminopimelate decarboxylase n=1 Tax=Banduia mediterranea TaxID=3075609 RepID=A0ABU2WIM7_9GAMM|nr:diaminopimelate decarboxylase [Algiphilus sp. W345]MDT0497146.1 diaminopimelate decarboxylase [Algiphilus sp. W345]